MKFAGGLIAAAATLSLAEPAVRLLVQVVAGPFTEAPPLRALLPSLVSALLAVLGLAWLVADASFDRRAPRWTIAVLAANLVLLSWASPSLDLRRPSADAAIAAALQEAKNGLAGDASAGVASHEDRLRELQERVDELPATSIRDRLFRPIAPKLVVLEDRDGPLLSIPEDASPATIFLAINAAQSAAWLTATTVDDRQVALLRDGGLPVVLGIPLCSQHASPIASSGGTPC